MGEAPDSKVLKVVIIGDGNFPTDYIIIIGFCLVNRDSFQNVTEQWQKDYVKDAKDAKVVLVGLKQDLVEDATELKKLSEKNQEPVTEEEMANVAKKVGASSHVRCSALTGDGVNEVFEEVVRASKGSQQKSPKPVGGRFKCNIL